MKSIVRWAVSNSPAVNTFVVATLIVGLFSALTMRREVFPEFELEILLVTVPYPGASPEEVEEGICMKIEEAVRAIPGIKKMTSVARESSGFMVLELEANVKDVQKILSEVRSEIDTIPSFPELAEDPEIQQIVIRDAAIRIAVFGPETDGLEGELALRSVCEEIRDDLLQLTNVSQANILGERQYQIDIEIPERTLRKYGLTLQNVAQIVRQENLELPGGMLRTDAQTVLLRGKNKRSLGEQIAEIPLVTQPNGAVLSVGDLGNVRDAFDDSTISYHRIDGQPGMVISVDRTSTEDLLQVVEDVRGYIETKELPPGYSLKVWWDQSIDVRDRMVLLARNGLQGLVLVFLVLAVFLELKLAFWVALGIPIAVLGACGVLLATGQTMNMLSMFSFLMALGIVVDDAIVVGENIYAHRQKGKSVLQAAIDGTVEVVPSVIASVSTTIIAFTPLLFVSGVMGKFIAVMPLAVIAMLAISLIESMSALPCHLAHSHPSDPQPRTYREKALQSVAARPGPRRYVLGTLLLPLASILDLFTFPLRRVSQGFHFLNGITERNLSRVIERLYVPSLRWSLKHLRIVAATAMAILFVTIGFQKGGLVKFNAFPKLDSRYIESKIVFPDGTPASVTMAAAQRMEQAIGEVNDEIVRDHGEEVVQLVYLSVGQMTGAGSLGPDTRTVGDHVGGVMVELLDPEDRSVSSETILDLWREKSGEFAGAESVFFGTPQMGPGGKAIEFKLLAPPKMMEELSAAVDECKRKLATYEGVYDIGDDSYPGKWEYQITVKDRAQAMGIPLSELAGTVRASYYGEEVMRLQRGRHEVKLMVRYPAEDRRSLASFEELRVRGNDGAERPLTELAKIDIQRGYAEINRIDQLRSITVTADVHEDKTNAREVLQEFQTSFLPELLEKNPGLRVRWEGQQEQTNESFASIGRGFAIAILAMFALLTIEFRSYFQPLIILVIIPFGAVGAFWGHFVMGLPVTLFSMFGMVALAGVIVNDSIVLIDFINHRLADGLRIEDALLEAGRQRFRPVLLTSVTTVAGLLPLLTETSFQAQILIPMATSLVFGLIACTVLIPLMVPMLYFVYYRIANRKQPEESGTNGEPVAKDLTASPQWLEDLVQTH